MIGSRIGQLIRLFAVVACASPVAAQTVQLPTFHTFSYSGAVQVPDRGTASLGSVNRSWQSQSQRGGLLGRGPHVRSASSQHAGASVTATIIDLDEIDRQVLGVSPDELLAAARRHANAIHHQSGDENREGKSLVRNARTLYRQGRLREARDTYQLAIHSLDETLRPLVVAEMRRLGLAY